MMQPVQPQPPAAPNALRAAGDPIANRGPADQRFVIHGVSWRTYAMLREALDAPGLRMTYSEGTLELMSPSPEHELSKKMLARLIEIFAIERDVPLNGWGSTTFRREVAERGAEPDEYYMVGPGERPVPDIALSVVVTSEGIDKLDVYRGLGVPEVWIYYWHEEIFRLYRLREGAYHEIARSELVADLDFEVLRGLAQRRDQHEAVKEFRDLLRQRSHG